MKPKLEINKYEYHEIPSDQNFHQDRLDLYYWFCVEKLINIDQVCAFLSLEGILSSQDFVEIVELDRENDFLQGYLSLRESHSIDQKSDQNHKGKLQKLLCKKMKSKNCRKAQLLLHKLYYCKSEGINIFQVFINILKSTYNEVLASMLLINPFSIEVGLVSWEKITLELWDELHISIKYFKISEYLVGESVISLDEDTKIKNIPEPSGQITYLLLNTIFKRFDGIEILKKALESTKIQDFMDLSNKLTCISSQELENLDFNSDFFINQMENIPNLLNELINVNLLTRRDLERIGQVSVDEYQSRVEIYRAIRRKGPETLDKLIKICNSTAVNKEVGVILSISREELTCRNYHIEAFEKLKLFWNLLKSQILYEDISGYFEYLKILKNEEIKAIERMESNEEKMGLILTKMVQSDWVYKSLFNALLLKSNNPIYEEILVKCNTMDMKEAEIILKTRDFLCTNVKSIDNLLDHLVYERVLSIDEGEEIEFIQDKMDQMYVLCSTIMQKPPWTVYIFTKILWTIGELECAMILTIDFDNFKLTPVEWLKMKQNWFNFVSFLNYESIYKSLAKERILPELIHRWIISFRDNRLRIRNLLRFLTRRIGGYEALAKAIKESKNYKLYKKCKLGNANFDVNFQFLVENTKNLPFLLTDLANSQVITSEEYKYVNYFRGSEELVQLYTLLWTKSEDFIKIKESLRKSGNFDCFSVLSVDLQRIQWSRVEWSNFLYIYTEFINSVLYSDIYNYLTRISKILSPLENIALLELPSNADSLRLLLMILPYKKGSYAELCNSLQPHKKYKHLYKQLSYL